MTFAIFLQTVDMTDVPLHTVTQPHHVVPQSVTSTDAHREGVPSIPATLPIQQPASGRTPMGHLPPPIMLWLHQQVFVVDSSCS